MIDLLGQAAIAVIGLLIGYFAFGDSSDDEGCNGHHWGEPRRPDADGVSRLEREKAGLPNEIVHKPREHLTVEVRYDKVVLKGLAIKKCQDCGNREVEKTTINAIPLAAFEDGWDVVPSDAYELDDDFGGKGWVVEQ